MTQLMVVDGSWSLGPNCGWALMGVDKCVDVHVDKLMVVDHC